MIPVLHPVRAFARAIGQSASGAALIEFALALPLVLSLGMGALELANQAYTQMKISHMSQMVADNAGRVITRIDESDINEVFSGATQLGQSINFSQKGRIILSSLQDNGLAGANHGQMINWQRCTGNLAVTPAYGLQGKGKTDASLQGMGPTGRQIQSLPNTAVMFVEVSYTYTPLIPNIFPPKTIRYESAFNVRERTEQDITNVKALPVNSC